MTLAPILFLLLFSGVRGRVQPVGKVGHGLVATTIRVQNAPKSACLVSNPGPERVLGEFFNSAP